MNETAKTRLIGIGAAAILLAGVATLVMPYAGGILAGFAIAGGLIGIGALETKKRAY